MESNTPHVPGDSARLARYAEYRAFYDGDQWRGPVRSGERRLVLNYARTIVNKAASYLMGSPPRLALAVDEGADAPGFARWLDEVSDFNHLHALDLDTAISAATLGDGAFTVRWDAAARLPRVTAVDPANLDAGWRGDDLHTLLWVEQRYLISAAELSPRALGAYRAHQGHSPGGDAPLAIREHWTASWWRQWADEVLVQEGPNPYGAIPYVLFPNLRVPGAFWGASDLVDLLGIQQDLNTRFSVLSRILEVSGNPIAVVENAADSAGLRVGPGQLWELPEGARAYLLDLLAGGGVQLHMDYLNLLYRALHDVAEMPRTSFGDPAGQGATSGVALEIELQPLLHKLARKRLTWSVALIERARLLLHLAAYNGVSPLPAGALLGRGPQIQIAWPAVLPQDRAALVAQEATLVTHAIHSRQRALALLDDPNPAAEWARIQAEAAALRVV